MVFLLSDINGFINIRERDVTMINAISSHNQVSRVNLLNSQSDTYQKGRQDVTFGHCGANAGSISRLKRRCLYGAIGAAAAIAFSVACAVFG